ncbi:MAG: redoxin domain-containing protein [Blastocatellia bacterium]|nr:redoxin domain-containing protein [Blastocatellia bacterium]MCS7157804.1 redoxin domain-containing protein [Blastocatellia bacterium]MCX7753317.1 redoxin domain-containing protein [Blastocatellia bacterium]MDW8168120.1 redoxin domain-containing protein [Acidobacteriota bacterium]MDW8257632.1 redoxin domain-containing protein [Acidobacteriota bacterium]
MKWIWRSALLLAVGLGASGSWRESFGQAAPERSVAEYVEEVQQLLREAGRADIAEKEAAAMRERARALARQYAARLKGRNLEGVERFQLGYLYHLADDTENALALFRDLVNDRTLSEEDRQRVRLALIERYCESGRLAEAEAERAAISPQAFNAREVMAMAAMRLAIAYTQAGQLERALQEQEKAYEAARGSGLVPLTWKAARALAELYAALGKHAESRTLLSRLKEELQRQLPWAQGEALQMLARTISQIESTLAQLELIGKSAPEIAVAKWIEEAPVRLADLRGRVVALEFWAAWCPDCRGLIPHLRTWAARYEKEGLKVLAVTRYYGFNGREVGRASREEEERFLAEFKRLRELPYGTAIDDGQRSFDTYHVTWVPTIAIIDRTGRIRYIFTWNENPSLCEWMIKQILGERS